MISESMLNQVVRYTPPSGIRKFFDLARTVPGVISLGVGEPDFDTPWHIREEAIYAIERGNTYYTGNAGLDELRQEICCYLQRRFSLSYTWDEHILVTVGGSEAIDIAFRAILNPGDEVIVLTPGYIAYEPAIRFAQGIPVIVELKEKHEFKLLAEDLRKAITPKTKALLINFPGNPTGGIMRKEDYAPLIKIIQEHNLLVVSDEIYAELTYSGAHVSIASFDAIKDQVILINGFSKAYAMTGWRLAYIAAHPILLKAMLVIHQYIIMCAPTISQFAAIAALKNGDKDVLYMRDAFEQRRSFLVNGLKRIGLPCHMPQGAFYVFANITSTKLSSQQFAEQLIAQEKVAVVPGDAFGSSGEGFIRISYAYSIEEIKEALERMGRFVAQIAG